MTKEEILDILAPHDIHDSLGSFVRRTLEEETAEQLHDGFKKELALLSDKLAKIELMYDKLANIHSKQEEKYNKLKEENEALLVEKRGNELYINFNIKRNTVYPKVGIKVSDGDWMSITFYTSIQFKNGGYVTLEEYVAFHGNPTLSEIKEVINALEAKVNHEKPYMMDSTNDNP